jgi:hypothetical protein
MTMTYHLSLGAHLLLWVFPLAVLAVITVSSAIGARQQERP